MENHFEKLLGNVVKAKYYDIKPDGAKVVCVVTGILFEINDKYIVVNDVIIGLNDFFIACYPLEGNNAN